MSIDSLDGFLVLVRDELGVDLGTADNAAVELADLPGWDSLHLLRLLALLEEYGHPVPVHRLLLARSVQEIYALVEERP